VVEWCGVSNYQASCHVSNTIGPSDILAFAIPDDKEFLTKTALYFVGKKTAFIIHICEPLD
jgi:hypothetical protein